MQLQLTVFGHFQLTAGGVPVKFATEQTRALFAYLTIEQRTHKRASLASLLWPKQTEAAARQNLRQTLVYLKRAFNTMPEAGRLLDISAQSVRLCREGVSVDSDQFHALWAACKMHPHPQIAVCPECIVRLQAVVALYQGEFLRGLSVKHSAPFDEWILCLREQFHRQALEALYVLSLHYEAAGDYEQMRHFASRQLSIEPWREEGHRQLMRALALSGQRTGALAHYAVCQRILEQELNVPPSPETTALYEGIRRGKVTTDPKPAVGPVLSTTRNQAAPAILHNLPLALTPLVGRERERAQLLALLQAPTLRLLTLTGPGGMGKTRLALAVAQQIVDLASGNSGASADATAEPASAANPVTLFPDGVFFVSLASILSEDALAPAIAAAIHLPLYGSDLWEALRQSLRSKEMLLILDNFEQLLPVGDSTPPPRDDQGALRLVLELLDTAPQVKMLITSRERLNLPDEHLVLVPPLPVAPVATLAEATSSSALRLFVESARRIDASFHVRQDNLAALLKICALVQGMPLGLEMAAARVDQLTLAEIAQEIERSSDFLTVEWRDVPDRQRSMRAVFDWSWRRLNDPEQRVLRQLAVFRGGFTYTAAQQIAGATELVLAKLVNKSLVRYVQSPEGANDKYDARYELHELLRQFAEEQLASSPVEQRDVFGRHCHYYLGYVVAREQRLARNDPHMARLEIQAELDNIRQAWIEAASQRRHAPLGESAYGLWQFFLLVGLFTEGTQRFHLAADSLQHDDEGAKDAPLTRRERLQVLTILRGMEASMLAASGKYDAVAAVAQAAIDLATAGETAAWKNSVGRALGHMAWGQALYHQGRFDAMQAQCEAALSYARREAGECAASELQHEVAVMAQFFLAAWARQRGDYAKARHGFLEGLMYCQRLGKLRSEIHAHLNLGHIALSMRNLPHARQEYESALSLALLLGYRLGEGISRYELGIVGRLQGEYSAALTLWEEALHIFSTVNDHQREVYVLTDLVELYSLMGDDARAYAWKTRLLEASQGMTAPDGERAILLACAKYALGQDDGKQALHDAEQAWRLVARINSRAYEADALLLMGHAQWRLRWLDAAAESYARALALYQSMELPSIALEAQAGLARIALERGDQAQAHRLAESIMEGSLHYQHAGLDEPFSIYHTCFRVLQTNHDRRAPDILARARLRLQHYANSIADDTLRQTYLSKGVRRALQEASVEPQRDPDSASGAYVVICAEPAAYVQ